MKILVSGGAGFIGCKLVKKLLDEDFEVTVLDSLVFGGESLLSFYDNPRFELVRGSILDRKKVEEALIGCDGVIHLAALVFIGDGKLSKFVDEVNYGGTKIVAEESINAGIKNFLFTSTCSNYGKTSCIVDEDSTLNPTNAYAMSKVKAEKYLLSTEVKDQLNPLILRLSTVFGLSPRMRFDLIVNELCKQATVNKKLEIFNPTAWRPGIHIDDVTDLILKCCNIWSCNCIDGFRGHNVFNVGNDTLNYQKIQLCNIIKEKIPELEITEVKNADIRDYRVSFERVKKFLSFVPKRSLKQGVNQIVYALKSGVFLHPGDISYDNLKTYQLYYHDKWREEK